MKKGIAGALLLAACLRVASAVGLSDTVMQYVNDSLLNGQILSASINFELGDGSQSEVDEDLAETEYKLPSESYELVEVMSPESAEVPDTADGEAVASPDILSATLAGGLALKNTTSYEVDVAALIAQEMTLKLSSDGPQILIIHTHGSEAYTPDGNDIYLASDTFRTQDKNFSVMRVGDELCAALESYGLIVVHDTEVYDYPSYNGSYGRSATAIASYLETYPTISVVIDLHRDSLGTGDAIYKTSAEVSGETSAQVMVLVGTNEKLDHPNWQENLKFALYLQSAVNNKYSSLMRSIALRPERFNQQLTLGSIILEVGSSGNTLQESLCAIRLFADAVAQPLLDLVE